MFGNKILTKEQRKHTKKFMFAKTKKKEEENRKLRFIEATLYSFAEKIRDTGQDETKETKKYIEEMIEDRAKEIKDWL